jgi:uncharacterized protein (UPF0335 family)
MVSRSEFVKKVQKAIVKAKKKKQAEIMSYTRDAKLKNYNRALKYRRGRMVK